MIKKTLTGLFAAALLATALTATAAPTAAEAAPRDGNCQAGEFCLYYNSNHQGSVSDFTTSVPDYGTNPASCYVYKGPGNGSGKCIKNDAASAWNRTSSTVTLFYNSNYGGATQSFAPGAKVNLNGTLKNNNASHRIGGGGGTTPPPSTGSYGTPRANPHGAAISRAPSATPRTQHVDDEIARLTGERDCWVGGYRSYESSRTNHNTGNALDCTISNAIGQYPNASQRAQGWELANWLRKHASTLQVRYVIWDGKIWSQARNSQGWRNYTAGTGVTNGHYDHVHVSINNPYGD